jgi:5-methylcytosine-specific restriction enzyme A
VGIQSVVDPNCSYNRVISSGMGIPYIRRYINFTNRRAREEMPVRPKLPCNKMGCPELVEPGQRYCDKHKKEYYAAINRTVNFSHLYNYKWEQARKRYLKVNPLCVECLQLGRTTPATIVDHIIPHKGDKRLFWDKSNWQSLCKRHHDRKTAKEDGGFGNKEKR